ncbi:MAG: hypothetical protein SAK29_16330 [Scytonema sp. PMC 1069.18]|nr:hypothetical protein [Scytonema sp. PMC 1069.18]MEC4883393.1 hypothetical protein [Scytonema sp. PMC 1070.18]
MQQWFRAIKWWFAILIMLFFPIGAAGWGLTQLLQLPALPNCVSESLSKDSSTSVFYCAKAIADDEDADKLSQAIELVNSLPKNHPQRPIAKQLSEEWSQAILRLGESAFQQGNIDQAVDIAKQIPDYVSTYQLADKRIKEWNSIWSKASKIYNIALAKINEVDPKNSYLALNKAKELLKIGNDYWETTKYQELVAQIQDIKEKKEEIQAIANKERLAKTTTEPEKMEYLDRQQEEQDLVYLDKARMLAQSGKIEDMIDAIGEASMVASRRYSEEAQKLIADIRRQMDIADDRTSLNRAKELASQNDVVSLEMAISEASFITQGTPLYKEANEYIAKWNKLLLKLQSQKHQQSAISN